MATARQSDELWKTKIVDVLANDTVFTNNLLGFAGCLGIFGANQTNFMARMRENANQYGDTSIQAKIRLLLETWNTINDKASVQELIRILDEQSYKNSAAKIQKIIIQAPEPRSLKVWKILKDDIGKSYKTILGPYLDDTVEEVTYQDRYIMNAYQVHNFELCFQLILEKCPNLKVFNLFTRKKDYNRPAEGTEAYNLVEKLKSDHTTIQLNVDFSWTCPHPRVLDLGNGKWCSLDKGLDYFQKYAEGTPEWNDLDLRKCDDTIITWFQVV